MFAVAGSAKTTATLSNGQAAVRKTTRAAPTALRGRASGLKRMSRNMPEKIRFHRDPQKSRTDTAEIGLTTASSWDSQGAR